MDIVRVTSKWLHTDLLLLLCILRHIRRLCIVTVVSRCETASIVVLPIRSSWVYRTPLLNTEFRIVKHTLCSRWHSSSTFSLMNLNFLWHKALLQFDLHLRRWFKINWSFILLPVNECKNLVELILHLSSLSSLRKLPATVSACIVIFLFIYWVFDNGHWAFVIALSHGLPSCFVEMARLLKHAWPDRAFLQCLNLWSIVWLLIFATDHIWSTTLMNDVIDHQLIVIAIFKQRRCAEVRRILSRISAAILCTNTVSIE